MAEPDSLDQATGDDVVVDDNTNATGTTGCQDLGDSEIGAIWLDNDGSVYYTAKNPVYGFQFNVEGTTVSGVSADGDASSAGFSTDSGDKVVVSFSFQGDSLDPVSDASLLVKLDLDGQPTGLSNIVVAGQGGAALDYPTSTAICSRSN